MSKPKRDFLQFLFEGSFTDAEGDLDQVIEALDEVGDLKIRSEPLEKAIAKIGLKPDGIDCEGVRVVFDDSENYHEAHGKLQDPEVMAQLAELGWVAVFSGDTAAEVTDGARYVIHFLALDEAPGPEAKQLEEPAARADVEKTFGRFQGPPVPEKTDANESVSQAVERLISEQDAPDDDSDEIEDEVDELVEPAEDETEDIAEIWRDDQDGEYVQIGADDVARYVAHGRVMEIIPPVGDDVFAGIREWMKEKEFWPNIWSVSDHGNVTLHDQNGADLGGLV